MYKSIFNSLLILAFFSYPIKSSADSHKQCDNINEIISGTTALSWLKEHKDESWIPNGKNLIMPKFYYEIGPLNLPYAIRDLKTTAIIELTNKQAKNYNSHYRSEEKHKPYLVRAVFTNYTGSLFITENQRVLSITHSSLGGLGKVSFTPLIVNLKEKPKKIVLSVSGAL